MTKLTKEEAKKMNILDVAHSLNMDMVKYGRNDYYWREHDSLKMNTVKNLFNWYSKGKGGDVIQLVQTIKNVSFKEAMNFLETGKFEKVEIKEDKKEPFQYFLGKYETNFSNGRNYLKNERALSDETIDFFLKQNVLALVNRQTKDGYKEQVIVFKYLDKDKNIVGGSLQGIVANKERYQGKGYLKQIMYNSQGTAGFNVTLGEKIEKLIFFEAPIDMMSYYELNRNNLNNAQLIAMDGLKETTISNYLSQHLIPNVDTSKINFLEFLKRETTFFEEEKNQNVLTLAVDNDKAGKSFIEKLKSYNINFQIDLPKLLREENNKVDWNDVLKERKSRKMEEKEQITESYALKRAKEKLKRLENERDNLIDKAMAHQKQTNGQPMNDKRAGNSFFRKKDNLDERIFVKMNELREQKERVEELEEIEELKKDGKNSRGNLIMSVDNIPRIREEVEKGKRGESFFSKPTLKRYEQELERLEKIKEQQENVIISQEAQKLIDDKLVNQWQKQPNLYFVKGLRKVAVELNDKGIFELTKNVKYQPKTTKDREFLEDLLKKQEEVQEIEKVHNEKTLGNKKSLDSNNQGKEIETQFGDFAVKQQAAPLPEEKTSQPLNDLSPNQTPSQSLLQFNITNPTVSIDKPHYHRITNKELKKLNRYSAQIQQVANWYLKELADSKIHYVYQDKDVVNNVTIDFKKENFMHLVGLHPLKDKKGLDRALENVANGSGTFENIMIADKGASFTKLQVLPELESILDSSSFYFDNLNEIDKFNKLDLSKAIKTEDKDLLLLFKETEENLVPASLMRVKGNLSLSLENIEEKTILGIYREREGKIEQLSINDKYIKDNGKEMKSIIENKQYEKVEIKEINSQTLDNQKTIDNKPKNDIEKLNNELKTGITEYKNSETYKKLLDAISKLRNYSLANTKLIYRQNPNATIVASMRDWNNKFERRVNKGAKGIKILVPHFTNKRDKEGNIILDKNGKPEQQLVGYGRGTVFDIEQTNGKEFPKIVYNIDKDVDGYLNIYKAIKEVTKENNTLIKFSDQLDKNTLGYYNINDNEIVLKSKMSQADTIKTLLHELTHSLLHKNGSTTFRSEEYNLDELEAESISYVVSKHYGIDTSQFSFGYLHNYLSDRKDYTDLDKVVENIHKQSKILIEKLDKNLEKIRNQEMKKDPLQNKIEQAKNKIKEKSQQNQGEKVEKKYPSAPQIKPV